MHFKKDGVKRIMVFVIFYTLKNKIFLKKHCEHAYNWAKYMFNFITHLSSRYIYGFIVHAKCIFCGDYNEKYNYFAFLLF